MMSRLTINQSIVFIEYTFGEPTNLAIIVGRTATERVLVKAEQARILAILKDDVEEVLQRDDERIYPVLAEVDGERGILVGTLEERQAEPLFPLVLRLQLVHVVLEELEGLLGLGRLNGVYEIEAHEEELVAAHERRRVQRGQLERDAVEEALLQIRPVVEQIGQVVRVDVAEQLVGDLVGLEAAVLVLARLALERLVGGVEAAEEQVLLDQLVHVGDRVCATSAH